MATSHALAIDEWIYDDRWSDHEEKWTIDHSWLPKATKCVWREQRLLGTHNRLVDWESLPEELDHIRTAIIDSKDILESKDEDENFLCQESTWKRAANFLSQHAYSLWSTRGVTIEAPEISPGPEGSVDLHWELKTYELLINIRADPSAPAGFYGDDKGKIKIKGTLDLSAYNEGLLLWLEKQIDVAERRHSWRSQSIHAGSYKDSHEKRQT
jgi:hypothetical protein